MIFQYLNSIFFLKGKSKRTKKALLNVFVSVFFKFIRILIGFILVPISIDYLGSTGYGIWLTIFSVFMWMQILDVGLGNGLRNRLAEAIAKGDIYKAKVYVSTSYFLLLIIVSLIFVFCVIIYPLVNWGKLFNAPQELWSQVNKTVFFMFIFICLQFFLQLILRVCQANQDPAYREVMDAFSGLVLLLFVYLLYKYTSSSLVYYSIAVGLASVIIFFVFTVILFKTKYKQFSPSIKFIKIECIKDIANLGITFFIIQLGGIVIYSTDNFLISHLASPKDVTVVNIAKRYFNIIFIGFLTILSPLWSAVTDAFNRGDLPWIKRAVNKLTKLWGLMVICIILMLIFSNYFYHLWIGERVLVPFSISFIIAVLVLLRTFGAIFAHVINGFGFLRVQMINAIIGAIINIPLSIFLAKTLKMGALGVIFSTVIILSIGIILRFIQYHKIINNRAKGIWIK